MKFHKIIIRSVCAVAAMWMNSCSDTVSVPDDPEGGIKMKFNFNHPAQTKATETAFENGDIAGLYVCPFSSTLEISGNTVSNEPVECNGSGWIFRRPMYWDTGRYNAFGYYPYTETIASISDMEFEVRTDQSAPESESSLSGYEASDFLYASVSDIEASDKPVEMTFRHIMSKVTVRLIKGEDFEGDLPEDAIVYIHNTVTGATVDLEAGVASKLKTGRQKTITTLKCDNHSYSAIVVPQRIDNRVPLIEVVMKGVSYLYDSKFIFKAGTHHIMNLLIDKNPEQIKIEVGGEIEGW